MKTAHAASEKELRFKSAVIGFGLTTTAVAALAGAQFLLAPHTVTVVGRMDPEVDAWAVSQLRGHLAAFHAIVIAILAIYWSLSAISGKGQVLRIRSANFALAFSGLIFALAMVVSSFVQVPESFRVACPVLGIADTFPPLGDGVFGFDRQTPCETFLQRAVPSMLLGLPTILLISSAVLRIVGSRKRR